MKYKVGDKVRIKTWKEMEEHFGLNKKGYISCNRYFFTKEMERLLNKNFSNRMMEIKQVNSDHFYYRMKYMAFNWADDMIKEKIISEPINSRFDILDIR